MVPSALVTRAMMRGERPIFRRAHVDGDGLAGLERAPRPAGSEQDAGRAPLGGPLDFAALPIVNREVQPGMRIHPLEFLDDAGHRNDLGHLVRDVAVVGLRRAAQRNAAANTRDVTTARIIDSLLVEFGSSPGL